MSGLINEDGRVMTEAEAQECVRRSIERFGCMILSAKVKPRIGEVQEFAGLPMRCAKFVSAEEGARFHFATVDIWGAEHQPPNSNEFFFIVEVAD